MRHAEGSDPIRIVVGGGVDVDIDCLAARPGPGRILLIGEGEEPASPQVERLALPTARTGASPPLRSSRELYRRGILSVYIEGGAATTSAFLAENNIDVSATAHLAAHHRPRDQFVPKAGDPVRGRIGALRQPCLPVGR